MCDKIRVKAFSKEEKMVASEIARGQTTKLTATDIQNCIRLGRALAALGDELNSRYQYPSFVQVVIELQRKRSNYTEQNKQ